MTDPIGAIDLRIETFDSVDSDVHPVHDLVAGQRAAFGNSKFTVERFLNVAVSPPFRRGRGLVGYDAGGAQVAHCIVWSAGTGRPGLIEPLGVHRAHRGKGHGRSITRAAAAALREMGSSSVTVCTPTANEGAVRAYVSAGFTAAEPVSDFRRPD